MAIPQNITSSSIIQALEFIDTYGIDKNRQSIDYDLVYHGKLYPPKYVISKANFFANGIDLSPYHFNSVEAFGFLRTRGFEIESHAEAIQSFSWTVINDKVAIKRLDRSAFIHNGTGVPVDIRSFFRIENFVKGESKETVLNYKGAIYHGILQSKNDDTTDGRTQLHWRSDFSAVLKAELPEWYDYFNSHEEKPEFGPELRLSRMEDETGYYVSIVDVAAIRSDIESELIENQDFQPLKEGRIKEYYGKRYERSAANRKRAIEIHGYECAVCGFDFFKVYGERGKEFIEVHHIKPISTSQEEIVVNPETDVVTVCANCHRMIHRYPDDILSTDELRERMTLNVIQ